MGFLHSANPIKEPNIPIIKIDDKDYDLDTLSDEARAQLTSLQFVDAELARLTARTAVLQTARMAYSKINGVRLDLFRTPFILPN